MSKSPPCLPHSRQPSAMIAAGLVLVCLVGAAFVCTSSPGRQPAESNPAQQTAIAAGVAATAQAATESTATSAAATGIAATAAAATSAAATVDLWVEERLAVMSLGEKVGQLIMLSLADDVQRDPDCDFIAQVRPAGVYYHPGNVVDPAQLRGLSGQLQGCAQAAGLLPLLIATDHEGQWINRFDGGVTCFPAAMAIAATGDPRNAYRMALASGLELRDSGVNMVLGPVADVLTNLDNVIVERRAYGGDPQQAAQFVAQAVAGYLQAGLIPVLKHFPGHGGVSADSHLELPVDPIGADALRRDYLPTFQAGLQAGAPAVMPAHIAYTGIDASGRPATVSKPVLDLLRAGLRFDGVLLSDDMDMKVIKASGINQQSLAALQAGMDMLLVTRPEQALWLHAFLLKAAQSGELPQARIDEAVRRTLRLKAAHGLATFDPPAAQPPDYAVNYQLAYELGGNALYIYRDRDALIDRFAQFRRILVVGPVENPGEGWKFYDKELKPVLESAGHELAFRFYTTERKLAVQEQGLLDEILADAPQYDLALVFTSLARVNHILVGDAWQGELVNRLLQGGQPVIVVAMSAATDLLEFPEAPAYIAMFGYTDGARQALVDVLLGRREAAGVNPLPGLP